MFFRKKKSAAEVMSSSAQLLPNPLAASVELTESDEPRRKILVIEDDPISEKMLSYTLGRGGYHVLSARDGAAAISLMRDEKPDMLVVDVGLPPDITSGGAVLSDGFQVTRWLHYANGRKVPAIVISATNREDYKQKAAAVGADGFMAKPLDSANLLTAVALALDSHRPTAAGFTTMKMVS